MFPSAKSKKIGGRTYLLSNQGPNSDPSPEYRWIWAVDKSKGTVAHWSAREGTNKSWGKITDPYFKRVLQQLQKKRQLNLLDHSDFQTLERQMSQMENSTKNSLQKSIEEIKTDTDRKTDLAAMDYFREKIEPKIRPLTKAIDRGMIPMGFDYISQFPESKNFQARMYVIGNLLHKELADPNFSNWVKRNKGFDPNKYDRQGSHWALTEARDKIYNYYKSLFEREGA